MSDLPNVKVTIIDGGLGAAPIDATGTHVKLGVCSAGPTNTLQLFTSQKALVDVFGSGPAVEAAALAFALGASPVGVMRVPSTVAGTIGSVTLVGTGTGTVTVTGTTLDGYSLRIKIVQPGAVGTASFALSIDGGDTYGDEIATASSYVVAGTGLTLAFSGTFVSGDVYACEVSQPGYTTGALTAAWDALLGDSQTWDFVHVIGTASTPSAQVAVAALCEAKVLTGEATNRFAWCMLDMPKDTDANLKTAVANFVGLRTSLTAGNVEVVSPVRGTLDERGAGWIIAPKTATMPISREPGQVLGGALTSTIKLLRDEYQTPGLDAARFSTLRTWHGRQGFYVTRVRIMAPSGSDFEFATRRRVANRIGNVMADTLLDWVNKTVRIAVAGSPYPGGIDERDAVAIEKDLEAALDTAVIGPGHVTSATPRVDRTTNVLSTNKIIATCTFVPLGIASALAMTVALENPAIAQAA